MIVFFGIKKKAHVLNIPFIRHCERCDKDTEHYFVVQKRAFTVFFLPLIPLGSKKYLVCRECKNAVRVKGIPQNLPRAEKTESTNKKD